MKKSKILLSLLLVAVMTLSLVSLIACTANDKDVEIVMWAPSGAQTFYAEWAKKWAEEYNKSEAAGGKTYTVIMGVEAEKTAATQMKNLGADGADVFCFVDDQMDTLLDAKLLSALGDPKNENAVLAKDIASRNTEGSVAAATGPDGLLYAFPMQADNTYFLFYDPAIISESELTTWDNIFEKVAAYNTEHSSNYRVQLDLGDPWYQSAFFYAFGGNATKTETNFGTDDIGLKALKTAHKMSMNPLLKVVPANDLPKEFNKTSQKIAVGVGGPFVYTEVLANNPNIKIAPLPKFVYEQEQAQMIPFLSNKLIGVNSLSQNIVAARDLANFMTSEAVQKDKMIKLSAGPSNINAANDAGASTSDIAKVLAAQSAYSIPQLNLPKGYWEAIKTPVNAVKTAGALADRTKDVYFKDGVYQDAELRKLLTAMVKAMELETAK